MKSYLHKLQNILAFSTKPHPQGEMEQGLSLRNIPVYIIVPW